MEMGDRIFYRNISIHISDRSHWNLALNVYNCGNQDVEIEHIAKPDYYIFYFVKEGKGYVTVRQATHKVEEMFDRLLASSTTLPNRYCKIMAQLYSIFGFLLDNAFREIQPEAVSPEFYLIKALDFIDTNYQDDISVEDIASSAGLNRKSLYAVFKSLTGFSPKDYLIYYRMCKATALLKDANLSVETVAVSVGYSDQFHFSKEFKKNVGLSPSVYRRTVAQDPSAEYQSPIDTVRQQFPAPAPPELPPGF